MVKCRYGSKHSLTRHNIQISGQIHTPADLILWKEHPVGLHADQKASVTMKIYCP